MTTIAILPEQGEDQLIFSAVAGEQHATGRTAGEALDALTAQLSAEGTGAPVIVQEFLPDEFFSAAQRDRLSVLMARWRAARDKGDELPPAEQAELERLVDEELQGATERTERVLRDFKAKKHQLSIIPREDPAERAVRLRIEAAEAAHRRRTEFVLPVTALVVSVAAVGFNAWVIPQNSTAGDKWWAAVALLTAIVTGLVGYMAGRAAK